MNLKNNAYRVAELTIFGTFCAILLFAYLSGADFRLNSRFEESVNKFADRYLKTDNLTPTDKVLANDVQAFRHEYGLVSGFTGKYSNSKRLAPNYFEANADLHIQNVSGTLRVHFEFREDNGDIQIARMSTPESAY